MPKTQFPKNSLFLFIHLNIFIIFILLTLNAHADRPKRVAIVSSYHPEFLWTSETNEGVLKALYEHKYLEDPAEGEIFTREEYYQNEKIVLKKWWMDSKRKSTFPEIRKELSRIVNDLNDFEPDIVLTGDDNATNYLGNYYIDSDTFLVFWGVNGSPMKYGLLDSLEKPGHNITGVYQADYLQESVEFLKSLLPEIEKIALLSDDSVSSRAKLKKLRRLGETGQLPVQVVTEISTNDYKKWQKEALEAAEYTDAFFMLNHNTLKDSNGDPIDHMKIGAWYLRNIKKPEVSYENHFIEEGMFSAVSDSGVKQGYMAMKLAIRILEGENPANIRVTAPDRGDYVVNRERAEMLNIYERIKDNNKIEAWVERAQALIKYPD
ncbi:MAG: ABC-type uncharacterized transport system substrate-binding protein [Cellvibrionaceae bacterium]|jgi:ABC-type uncharacterized transport system substrate-binding protein